MGLDILVAIAVALFFGFLGLYLSISGMKKNSKKDEGPSSFASRRDHILAEIQERKSKEQLYQESIEAAFKEAREAGELIAMTVSYDDIRRDMYRCRARENFADNVKNKTLLTRITPILTPELAERVRAYEIATVNDFDSEECDEICLAARNIYWRTEEVPEKYEPPNLKDGDRILYPDLSSAYVIPKVIVDAARKMLKYELAYVAEQAELLAAKTFEVTEE
jgi:hypothetical protein